MTEDQEEVSPLSRRVSLLVSEPLQFGFRFLLHPLPASPLPCLAAQLPLRERYGLTVFRMCDRIGVGPSSYAGGHGLPMTDENGTPVPDRASEPNSIFGPFILDDTFRGLLTLTMPSTLAPCPPDAGRAIVTLRIRYPS